MVDPRGTARGAANLAGAGATADVAARIVADARVGRGIDPDRAAAALTEPARRVPAAAASARAGVEAGMTPVERAQFDVRMASNDNPAAVPASSPPPDRAGMILDLLHRAAPASLPLPQSAKDRLLAMRPQHDEALAPAARQSVRTFDNAVDFNRAASAATPNTTYACGSFRFTTDGAGWPSVAEGRVTLTPAGRNDPALQAQTGREGRDTDVGFHLVADPFGGQGNRLNVVAGNGRPVATASPT